MMNDAETLRRYAASCMIDACCQISPLHAALRDEERVNDWLLEAYVETLDAGIFSQFEASTNRLIALLHQFAGDA